MELSGMKTIYADEVAYVPGAGGGAIALDPKFMMNFCDPGDADQIIVIARQVVPDAQLAGTTEQFTVTWNPNTFILQPGPDEVFAKADSSGGRFMYGTADGYRPITIESAARDIHQYVSELVASYSGQTGMIVQTTPQGTKLLWA